MKRTLIIIGIICFINTCIMSQDIVLRANDFDNKEDFREAKRLISKADIEFVNIENFSSMQYALENYLLANSLFSGNALLNYRIGYCYQKVDSSNKSLFYLKKAYSIDSIIVDDIHFRLGIGYQMNNNFNLALKEFAKYRDDIKRTGISKEKAIELYRRELNCRNAEIVLKDTLTYDIINMGPNINTKFPEYGAILVDNRMYFTSRRKVFANNTAIDGYDFENIFFSDYNNDKNWSKSRLYDSIYFSKNRGFNFSIVDTAKEENQFLVYNDNPKISSGLCLSKFIDNSIIDVKPFNFEFDDHCIIYDCIINDENDIAYIVVYMLMDNISGKDIFYSKRVKNKWSEPMNIGPHINTPFNESNLFISKDGKTVYFSSQGHNSIGGYDIFKITIDENGNWSHPENLGYPLNTIWDDFYNWEDENGKKAYISSNRPGGYGGYDIYMIKY